MRVKELPPVLQVLVQNAGTAEEIAIEAGILARAGFGRLSALRDQDTGSYVAAVEEEQFREIERELMA